jgi:ankyrin repeat protein
MNYGKRFLYGLLVASALVAGAAFGADTAAVVAVGDPLPEYDEAVPRPDYYDPKAFYNEEVDDLFLVSIVNNQADLTQSILGNLPMRAFESIPTPVALQALYGATMTPLFLATYSGADQVVKVIIDYLKEARKGKEIDTQVQGVTPLLLAAGNGCSACAALLLQAGANLEFYGPDGLNPLMKAAYNDNSEVVQEILNFIQPKTAAGKVKSRFEAVGYAVGLGSGLINKKTRLEFDADRVPMLKGSTALIIAARNGNGRVVQLLCENGADINAVDTAGRTALFYAVQRGHMEVVAELLKHHPNLEMRDAAGTTIFNLPRARQEGEINRLLRAYQVAEEARIVNAYGRRGTPH